VEIKKNFKETRAGLIPLDWESRSLQSITSKIGDGLHGTPKYSSSGSYSFINGNNLVEGKITITDDTKFVDDLEFQKYVKPLTNKSILMSINGTIGNLAFYSGEKIVLGKSAAYLNIKSKINREFIYYSLQSQNVKKQFSNGLTGSTIGNLGLDSIRNTHIPLPILDEQLAISSALSDVDKLINKLDQLIEKKRYLKKSVMYKLLTGQIRLPGFTKKWHDKTFEDLLIYEQPTSYIVQSSNYNEAFKTPVLTAGKSFILGFTNEKKGIFKKYPVIIFDDFTTSSKYIDFEFKVKSSAIKILHPKNSYINLKFVHQIMEINNFSIVEHKRHWISEYQKIKIQIPELKEQNAIETVISTMESEINSLSAKLKKIKNLKKAMVNVLLTGTSRLNTKR